MKPPIQYFGAKGTIAEQIVRMMPPHEGYIEPFAGSLAVMLAKAPSKIEVANDLDKRVMTFWRVLRDRGDELIALAEMTPHSRAELDRAAALDADDEMELARQVWVVLTQGRSRTLQRTGWRFFADPRGTSSSFRQYMDAYRDRLEPAMERLRGVSLECRPALDVIGQYGAFSQNLLYVDPPYLSTTRRAGRYAFEMGGGRPAPRPRGRAARVQGDGHPLGLRLVSLRGVVRRLAPGPHLGDHAECERRVACRGHLVESPARGRHASVFARGDSMSRRSWAVLLEDVTDLLEHGMSPALIPQEIGTTVDAIAKAARCATPPRQDIAAKFATLASQNQQRRADRRSGIALVDVRDRDLFLKGKRSWAA